MTRDENDILDDFRQHAMDIAKEECDTDVNIQREANKEGKEMTEEENKLMMDFTGEFVKKFFGYTKNIPELTTIQIYGKRAIVTFVEKERIRHGIIEIEEENSITEKKKKVVPRYPPEKIKDMKKKPAEKGLCAPFKPSHMPTPEQMQ